MGANPAQCPLCSGLQALGQTFGANPAFASSLRYLDLSKNPGLLATDEANVSPWDVASTVYKCMLGIRGPGSFYPMAPKGRGMLSTFPFLYPFFPQALYSFLAQPNALVHLDLSGTDCAVDLVRGWVMEGAGQGVSKKWGLRGLFHLTLLP